MQAAGTQDWTLQHDTQRNKEAVDAPRPGGHDQAKPLSLLTATCVTKTRLRARRIRRSQYMGQDSVHRESRANHRRR
jgi:hypothetical protein